MQNRSLDERTMHTRNPYINSQSIAIALAGNFETAQPSQVQLDALKDLVSKLDAQFHFERIIGHREASPDACPGKYLMAAMQKMGILHGEEPAAQVHLVSRYYTPVPGQLKYYRKTYEEDFKINCSGDCLVTADGYRLKPEDAYKVAACPPEMPFGTKLNIQGIGTVTCHDHGSAIHGKRIDIWAGGGEEGLRNIATGLSGYLTVTQL